MNRVLSFFDKQLGICNDLTYDFALPRLCVPVEDSWKGIQPSQYGSDFNPEPPLFSAKFANCANYKHILALANEDGKIALQDTTLRNKESSEQSLQGQQCHFNAVFDVEWVPGQMKFVSASGDHTARLWEIKEAEVVPSRVFNGHTRSVKTAAFRKHDSAVFATGGRDGAILIWDTRAAPNLTSRADNCIFSGHAGGPGTPISSKKKTKTPKLCPNGTSSSITGLVFQDDYTLISCGAGDGIIKVWDMRRNYTCYKKEPLPKYSLPYAGSSTFKAFTNLLIDAAGTKLYANCMDNIIYCYNLSSYSTKPLMTYNGLRNSTFYIKSCLSPDGNYLISGSGDEKAYIWNVKNSQPLVTLNGHTAEVTCVAWSGAGEMPIVTGSDDARHMIWRIGPEKITQDEKPMYRGHAEYCIEYKNVLLDRLKSLEHTPRSLRRLVEQNEKTPSSVEKIPRKRSFSDINDVEEDPCGSDKKRPHLETRGRRLFSPSTSHSSRTGIELITLSSITEETDKQISSIISHPEDSNQENPPNSKSSCTSCSTSSSTSCKVVSPLSERIDFNLKSPESGASTSPRPSSSSSSMLFSPTSNLPNYVIDGEAPHLQIMSPKRIVREKVDWLTKIRKQKMMSSRRGTTISEKLNLYPLPCELHDVESKDICLSPRLQTLKASESSPKIHGTPKRRISRSGSNSEMTQPRTPTATRRNSETSILRFFSILSQTDQPNVSNTPIATASISK